MGTDAIIWVKPKNDIELISDYFSIKAALIEIAKNDYFFYGDSWAQSILKKYPKIREGRLYDADICGRLYTPDYKRGYWPDLCALLLEYLYHP